MTASSTARSTAMRARRKAGIGQFIVEHNVDRLVLALGEDGFLKEWDDNDLEAIGRALNTMVETYVVEMLGEPATPLQVERVPSASFASMVKSDRR